MKPPKGVTGYHGRERREIPDRQVKDAADQFDAARQLLLAQPPGSGVLLPLLNAAIVAVELYLKALAARQIFEPVAGSEWSKVHAEAQGRHSLKDVVAEMPPEVREALEDTFRGRYQFEFSDALAGYEGLFSMSRYPYEPSSDITKYPFGPLMTLCDFLCEFVTTVEPMLLIDGQNVERREQ